MNNLDELWSYFLPVFGRIGTAALLGNVRAESAYNPKNLQNSYEKRLGYTDDSYTAAVDSGAYPASKFTRDSAGYGLCQWTHWSRKQNLYNFCKSQGASIGDLLTQAAFTVKELTAYGLADDLKAARDLRSATELILKRYEKPADQSDANVTRRTVYAQSVLERFPEEEVKDLSAELTEIAVRLEEIAASLSKRR